MNTEKAISSEFLVKYKISPQTYQLVIPTPNQKLMSNMSSVTMVTQEIGEYGLLGLVSITHT